MKQAAFILAGALVALAIGQTGGCGQTCVSRSQLKSGAFQADVAEYTTANYKIVVDSDFTEVNETFDLDGKPWQRTYKVLAVEHLDKQVN